MSTDAKLGLIQIGAGAWGESWAGVVAGHGEWELAGVVDLDLAAARRAAAAAELPEARAFGSLEAALAAGLGASALLVVVPPPLHAAVAVEALEAGLHCLIEKPLADTLDSAWSIVTAAERAERHAVVSQNYRYKRGPQTVRRLIADGTIGAVEQVRVDFAKDPPFEGFRLEMAEPLINDMAVHHLDQIRGIVGTEPETVRARSWNPSWSRFGGNASCVIELECGAGPRVLYTGSWCSRARPTTWDGEWEIEGARGSIRWAENRVEVRFESLFDTVFMPGAVERDGVMHVDLDAVEYEERAGTLHQLASAIHTGTPAETNVADNVRSLALVIGAVQSASTDGKSVDLRELAREPRTSDR